MDLKDRFEVTVQYKNGQTKIYDFIFHEDCPTYRWLNKNVYDRPKDKPNDKIVSYETRRLGLHGVPSEGAIGVDEDGNESLSTLEERLSERKKDKNNLI
jgi:hypothetical protein